MKELRISGTKRVNDKQRHKPTKKKQNNADHFFWRRLQFLRGQWWGLHVVGVWLSQGVGVVHQQAMLVLVRQSLLLQADGAEVGPGDGGGVLVAFNHLPGTHLDLLPHLQSLHKDKPGNRFPVSPRSIGTEQKNIDKACIPNVDERHMKKTVWLQGLFLNSFPKALEYSPADCERTGFLKSLWQTSENLSVLGPMLNCYND